MKLSLVKTQDQCKVVQNKASQGSKEARVQKYKQTQISKVKKQKKGAGEMQVCRTLRQVCEWSEQAGEWKMNGENMAWVEWRELQTAAEPENHDTSNSWNTI